MPPSPLPWPRFSSLRTRFPAFVQCHSLEIGGGEGKKPVSGRREGGPLLRCSLSIVREQPYVLDPDSDPGGPNPDEIFAKVKTRSEYFASRLFPCFSITFPTSVGTVRVLSHRGHLRSFPPAYFARTANRSRVHTLRRAFCLCFPRLCLGAKGKLDH